MQFRPVKQINTIIRQQYFEPTISWSLRVVLALNVPLIVIPLYKGFSYEVIWSAFGAYMLSLIDYRGLHYKKIVIQLITALLVVVCALTGMYVTHSAWWSVLAMFTTGMCVALIRNWSDYGPSIAISAGFFFLFGLATPVSVEVSLDYALYLMLGCAWAMLITAFSFPFQPSNPLRRSVAKIWKANTDLLDVMIRKLTHDERVSITQITEKELAVRNLINQSRNLFATRENKKTRVRTHHYDQMIELRKTASLFAAALSSMQEELEMLNGRTILAREDVSIYKTLSAFAQAGAGISIVIFTQRPDDLELARIRVKRCEVAVGIFNESVKNIQSDEKEKQAIRHFTEVLYQALYYLQLTISQVDTKQNIAKSDYLENYKLSFHEFMSGLKPAAFAEFIRELSKINSDQFIYALRVAIGLALGVFLFKFFNIDHGYWIPLTMMIVIQPYYGATLKRGLERMVGTVAGIVLGGIIMLLPLPREVHIGILIVDSFCVAYFLRNNYKVGVFFVTIMMVLLMQISQQGTWQLIGWRIVSTVLGALLALAAGYAFWPSWEKKRFPALLVNALTENKSYLLQVIRYAEKKLPAAESWHRNRRLAEGANNAVFVSVQRMLQEPEHARTQVDRNLIWVSSSIRITREITSAGLSLEKDKLNSAEEWLHLFSEEVSKIFDVLIFNVSGSRDQSKPPDFNPLKEALNEEKLRENNQLRPVLLELEKIVFELEAMCALA
jgi:uncharacterized membrane protein YccC